jgi:branched-chain amino acid aminotransferase
MNGTHVCVDGVLFDAAVPQLLVTDRGFPLGDAVFETLRARAGKPIEIGEHVARLSHALELLEIPVVADLGLRLERWIADLLTADGLAGPRDDAAVRVTISRGAAPGRGVLPPDGLAATIVVQAWPMAPPPRAWLVDGLQLTISSVRRDPENPMAAITSTSRADSVFARLEARRAGADDALFLTTDGYLAEATSANLFVVHDRRLRTPSLDCAVLPGTTRGWLLQWAGQAGLRPEETFLTSRDLAEADEAFLSSSIAGVLPVTRFEGRAIGGGVPGPWTRRARADREACFGAEGAA